MRDLKEEFGFTIGPWNQAYQVVSILGYESFQSMLSSFPV